MGWQGQGYAYIKPDAAPAGLSGNGRGKGETGVAPDLSRGVKQRELIGGQASDRR